MPINFKENNETNETVQKLDTVGSTFKMYKPQVKLDEVILNEGIKEQILDLIAIPEVWDKVFHKWNLKNVIRQMPKMAVNFYGPSGTGKTLLAKALSREIGKPLMQVNYAEIESKYVGETSKNLSVVFKQAGQEDAILLFDEADALLSRRVSDMKNALDVSVNQTRSVLLNLLDEYKGMIIFTTNFISNFDPAFLRRIPYHIRIDLPDRRAREQLWDYYLIETMPSDVNKKELTEKYSLVSGSDIVNSIVIAAIKTARKNEEVVKQTYIEEALVSLQKGKNENAKESTPIVFTNVD